MADENLLATLEQNLRQQRQTRARFAGKLAELEAEAEKVRNEMNAIDLLAGQTEATIRSIMTSVLGATATFSKAAPPIPSDAAIEAALREDTARSQVAEASYSSNVSRAPLPEARADTEVQSDRFFDRTIPQATALLLRELGAPLHVNELYNRLLEGGFQFTGQHPTISIAVSLNRNRRFRKVAPGTFDLVIRDASSQAS
ncbi:MAG: hypothetical protein H0V88_05130 [Pyrinomonadaceae bacterium]|nr:hypothetical protein [Pyrinomonadaceae bacterium]